MLAEAEHLDRMVEDLLVLARLEADDFPLEIMPVEVVSLLSNLAESWSARFAAAGGRLRTELPAHAVFVRTDPGRVRQVVDGLLGNALRVVPPGAPVVVAVRAEHRDEETLPFPVVGSPRRRPACARPGRGGRAYRTSRSRSATVDPASPTTTSRWSSSAVPSTSGTRACARWAAGWGWRWPPGWSPDWAARSPRATPPRAAPASPSASPQILDDSRGQDPGNHPRSMSYQTREPMKSSWP